MKFLVFGIISSSLLSELQVMIPKVNHNGVCICIVWVVFGLWTLEYLSGYKLRVRQDKCTNSKFLVNYQGRGSAWNRQKELVLMGHNLD